MEDDMKVAEAEIREYMKNLFSSGDRYMLSQEGVDMLYRRIDISMSVILISFDKLKKDYDRKLAIKGIYEFINNIGELISNMFNVEVAKLKQAELARQVKASNIDTIEKEAKLIESIKKQIEAASVQHDFSVSEKFAGLIRPGVLKNMDVVESKDEKKWPSISTIKNRLKRIKEGKA